ncbi:hypothetical protein BJV82DRAFT_672135 [Fennellomyces sp. T-0311]|nr:hypothetical protein BJV82DRAFT_672135 [Fennellomyces sp. T-0311]
MSIHTNPHSAKRFPTACRFFSQGNCRAGDECMFAHILPIKGSPSNAAHQVRFGDAIDDEPLQQKSLSTSSETPSIHKVIRDHELGQLEKNYKHYFREPSKNVNDEFTVVNIDLPLPDNGAVPSQLELQMLVPCEYPQTQCTIQIKNANIAPGIKGYIEDAFETYEWHQRRHLTLLQHLDWLKSNFAGLYSQAIADS